MWLKNDTFLNIYRKYCTTGRFVYLPGLHGELEGKSVATALTTRLNLVLPINNISRRDNWI